MKITSDGAKAGVYIVGGLLVLYAIYTFSQVGKRAAAAVADTANRVAAGVSNFVADTTQPVRDAFAETTRFRSYPQIYSPSDLNGSMTRQDALIEMNAINYQIHSAEIDRSNAASDVQYDAMGNVTGSSVVGPDGVGPVLQ